MNCYEKLKILADGAKYDASCATSGVERKNAGRMGNTSCAGICHSWSADGRCISLLKVLLSNKCVYDCVYCINRRTADIERASFEPEELAGLTMEFYRRNYIEGLFLSSAVEGSPDQTAERMLCCLSMLRNEHGFAGYIHAKIIPGASPEIINRIGMVADRISVNIEFPSEQSLKKLAPQKKSDGIFRPMKQIADIIADRRQINQGFPLVAKSGAKYKERFAPAGQSTQMIIGASNETDRQIIKITEGLYKSFRMKRVYFSAYIPVNESPQLPPLLTEPPLIREHRLYQADWLLRFYGFKADEILDEQSPFLEQEFDPKMTWALRNLHLFPMEINKVSLEELLRIPGIGAVSARRIVRQRRMVAIKFDDLKKLGVVIKRAKYFITCNGKYYGKGDFGPEYVRGHILEAGTIINNLSSIDDRQISMFTQENKAILWREKKGCR